MTVVGRRFAIEFEDAMSEISPGTALRELNLVQANLRKARQALRIARGGELDAAKAVEIGWGALTEAHRRLAAFPRSAATEDVMLRQIAVQRYATALLVRLRRLLRNERDPHDDVDDDFGSE